MGSPNRFSSGRCRRGESHERHGWKPSRRNRRAGPSATGAWPSPDGPCRETAVDKGETRTGEGANHPERTAEWLLDRAREGLEGYTAYPLWNAVLETIETMPEVDQLR